jgi:hypothetical protein
VRFASRHDAVTVVANYRTENCDGETEWMRLRAGPLLMGREQRMGMPLWQFHENGAREVFVAAASEMYFMFFGSYRTFKETVSCAVPAAVEFREGDDYELLFEDCTVQFSRLVVDAARPRRELVRRFEARGNRGCKEAFEADRLW